jgi:hypothetical protein
MSYTYDYYDFYGRKQPRSSRRFSYYYWYETPRHFSYYCWDEIRPLNYTFTLRVDGTRKNKVVCVRHKDDGEYIRQRKIEHEESQREVERMVKRKRNGVKVYRKKCANKQIGSDDE